MSRFAANTVAFKTTPRVDWSQLDETWAAAGELEVFSAGWLNDHLTDVSTEGGGPILESLTLLATLIHRVPGVWVGHAVLSNTFRHPSVVAKAATLLDQATDGRFVLGLGAGWHEEEHRSLGITLPPLRERIDRLESAVEVMLALFSPEAAAQRGVTRQDRFYPLEGALNQPPPRTPGGPPIFLGGQGPRGIALAGRAADGWLLPGINAGDDRYFSGKRDELLRALEAAGRPSDALILAGQVNCGPSAEDRRTALHQSLALQRAGATHLILGMDPALGPDGLRVMAREVTEPFLEATGWQRRPA